MRRGASLKVVERKWHYLPLALFAFVLCAVASGQQKTERCPWLNAATAAGVLGGDVRMSVTSAEKEMEQPNGAPGDAACEFVPVHGSPGVVLRITVHTMRDHAKEYAGYAAACGNEMHHIAGVGNEAIACLSHNSTTITYQIIGRVRERAFVLSLSLPAGDATANQAVPDKLQNTAEQIAGSLF